MVCILNKVERVTSLDSLIRGNSRQVGVVLTLAKSRLGWMPTPNKIGPDERKLKVNSTTGIKIHCKGGVWNGRSAFIALLNTSFQEDWKVPICQTSNQTSHLD